MSHAVWLCACETPYEAPTWLIHSVGDDGIGWMRLTTSDASDAVEADHLTGRHPDPVDVLRWLRGDQPYPWPGTGGGDFPEHRYIYDELMRRVRTRP